MKKTEIILAAVIVLAIISKALLIPMATVVLVFSSLSLGLIYMVGGSRIFAITNTEENSIENNERFSTIAGYSMALACVGILFTFSNWPGAKIQLTVGFVLTSVMFLVTAWLYIKTDILQQYYKKLALRLIVFVAVCGSLYLCPPLVLFSFFHRNDPGYVEAYKNWIENPKDTAAAHAFNHYMDSKK